MSDWASIAPEGAGDVPAWLAATNAAALRIPRIAFPVVGRLHEDYRELEERTLAWASSFALIRTPAEETYLRAATLGRTYAWMIPTGATDRVLLACQFCIWATIQDDRITEGLTLAGRPAAVAAHLLRCEALAENPRTAPAPKNGVESAYRDLFSRIEKLASPEQVLRIRKGMLHYSVGAAADAAYAAAGMVPPVAEYRRIRHLIAHLHHHFVLTEVAQGWEAPAALLLDPVVRRLTDLAIGIIGLTNDVYGCPRDVARGHIANLPMVLAHHEGCTVQEGMERVADEVAERTAQFALGARRVRGLGETAHWYVRGLEDQVAGHLAWLSETGRYGLDQ
ncbi:terpene synthase family protein [Streptomyces noursei]